MLKVSLKLNLQMSKMQQILAFILLKQCWGLKLESCKDTSYDKLCTLSENYNNYEVPGSLPLILMPVFDIQNIAEVNINEGSITIYVELYVNWEDQNIVYNR